MTFEPIEVSLDENCFDAFIRRYHFNDSDKLEIIRTYRKIAPRVHAIFHYVLEKDKNGNEFALVVASLGRAIDEYQNMFLSKENIQQAYIVDCLGLELLSLAYDKIDEMLHEKTGLFAGGYQFAGSDVFPLEELPEAMKKLGQKKIRYNDAYVLLPKKSVVFRTPLYKEKQEKHSRCSGCSAKNCSFRSSEYSGVTVVLDKNRDAETDKEDEGRGSLMNNVQNAKGLVHLYTGEGKGKTTASIGLAVRAAGAGRKVVFTQFMKGRKTSELNSFEELENIKVIRSSKNLGWFKKDAPESVLAFTNEHNRILGDIENLVEKGQCDVLIMDEATYPYNYGIVDKKRFEALILNKPAYMEIVLTGRNAPDFFIDNADYITEMKKIRHPYDGGIEARLGIEY
ncbi:cob(I)yrinic acid a,c-diamide adenosyltransferase [Butyrivibrio sp.]|uniref:cob(I)yrinic acid a,c-diamide adenosyltransferase n=1 Tax=Butyrivibrio sp. TaxID=28121 RepID=UPI0025BF9631|nr:cob(I)yrinic acid a,c-diamide adenosyltransferase [Butyrivibrio sp.]